MFQEHGTSFIHGQSICFTNLSLDSLRTCLMMWTCLISLALVSWTVHLFNGLYICFLGCIFVSWTVHLFHGMNTCCMNRTHVSWAVHLFHELYTCLMNLTTLIVSWIRLYFHEFCTYFNSCAIVLLFRTCFMNLAFV